MTPLSNIEVTCSSTIWSLAGAIRELVVWLAYCPLWRSDAPLDWLFLDLSPYSISETLRRRVSSKSLSKSQPTVCTFLSAAWVLLLLALTGLRCDCFALQMDNVGHQAWHAGELLGARLMRVGLSGGRH